MRKFRIFIQDEENDETVLEYPIPTHFIGNGIGGGTETPVPTDEEKLSIKDLMTTVKQTLLGSNLPKPEAAPNTYQQKCECGATLFGRTEKLLAANFKLHRRYKHDGAKVGTKN